MWLDALTGEGIFWLEGKLYGIQDSAYDIIDNVYSLYDLGWDWTGDDDDDDDDDDWEDWEVDILIDI